MKSYEEMAEQVLKRSEKEIAKRNMQKRKAIRIVSSLSCFCIIAVICFSVYNNDFFDYGKNSRYQEQSVATNKTGNEVKEQQNYKYSTNSSVNREQTVIAGTSPEPAYGATCQEADKVSDVFDSIEETAKMESLPEITTEQAVKNAREKLSDKEIETIINLENPKIEEVVLKSDTSIYLFDESIDFKGESFYKITYNTELDGLLGPITFYVDKMSGIVIGADYRE